MSTENAAGARLQLAALGAVLVLSTAGAQTPQDASAVRSQSAPAPRLATPLGGERIDVPSGASPVVVFVWSAPLPAPGIPPPQRYRLCLAAPGTACTAPGAILYDAGTSTRFEAAVPATLAGRLLVWSVGACGPGYGTSSADGAGECSWPRPRTLDTRGP